VIAVLLQQRSRTAESQHIKASMAATMLAVNERAGRCARKSTPIANDRMNPIFSGNG